MARLNDPARYARRKAANAFFVGLTSLATLAAILALVAILSSLLANGLGGVNLAVFTTDTPGGGELMGTGGLRNAIVGSLLMCAVGMALSVVVGILVGTYLAEYGDGNRLASTADRHWPGPRRWRSCRLRWLPAPPKTSCACSRTSCARRAWRWAPARAW